MISESSSLAESESATSSPSQTTSAIEVRDLEMSYGSYVVMRDINFTVMKGQVLVIMGGSGCGKSTLLKYMIGLKEVTHGDVLYNGKSFVKASQ
jgi:phospholipid/cholesterol/gamma-HCH transport system ATP-binding protein